MDIEQPRKQEIPKGSDAFEALLLVAVMVMVLALTSCISVRMPQALDSAARHAHAAGIVLMEADAEDEALSESDASAESPATEIADDLRREMQVYAASFNDAAEG